VSASSAAEPPLVRRAVAALLLTALLAFAVVGALAVVAARRIADGDALSEAARAARNLGEELFAPALPAVLAGDAAARADLDEEVKEQGLDGTVVRVKVWNRDGVVLYSDEDTAVGRRFPPARDVLDAIDRQLSAVSLSNLDSAENVTEVGRFTRLVEVYVPLVLTDGRRLALEIYSSDAHLAADRKRHAAQLVPLTLLAMLVLVVAQLPASIWLVRRVGWAQEERRRLLRSALTASDRERRSIARDLHDGVVPELAGVGYALDSLASSPGAGTPEHTRRLLATVSTAVRHAVGALRTLMVDIYPPDLTAAGLPAAIEGLADPLRDAGVEVTVRSALRSEPSPEITAALYRGAREGLANIAKHAQARHAWVQLSRDRQALRLRVEDDGVGLPPARVGSGANGHLGVRLLGDAVTELGGSLQVTNRPGGGTALVLELPVNRADPG
jgi:signal transduction histidine kinase